MNTSVPGTFSIRIKVQVGDWNAEHEQLMTFEQRANLRDGEFGEFVKRMFDEAFAAFENRHPH